MSTPGISLFQGTESINVDTSFERAQEEEALEDERRRKEELNHIMAGAFDDLDAEDTTVDSTSNFQSDLVPHQQAMQHNDHNCQQLEYLPVRTTPNYEAEVQQLKLLLESRSRELQTFQQLANDEVKKRDELGKRLAIAQAELDRALVTKKTTHELLVESKEKCSNLESVIAKLKADKKSLEDDNNALLGKLEITQNLLSDVQRKYDMVERDLSRHNERNVELKRKHVEERHRAEIEMMQQQIEQLSNKLEKKSNELEMMNTRYNALQSSHEVMLIDKTTKINDLNNALNEAHKRCEELLSKEDYFQENIRLQKLVANLQDQIQSMEQTITTLNGRLAFTTAELDVMDSVLHQHNLEDTPPPSRVSQTRCDRIAPLNAVDRVGSLKDELYRALANVKHKREEIRRLQRTLDEKQDEIRLLKNDENRALVQITTLSEENTRLENRLRLLEEEHNKSLDKSRQSNRIETKLVANEVEQLKNQTSLLEKERNELAKEKRACEEECKKLNSKLHNLEIDLEEVRQAHESMKLKLEQTINENQHLRNRNTTESLRLDLERHKFLLKDSQTECDRLKNLYVEISNTKEALALDLEKLRSSDANKQLQEEREKAENLQKALQLTELKSIELTKILETTKISYEREITALREKLERQRTNDNCKEVKDTSNDCRKCIEHLAEITKLEIESLKMKNEITTNRNEVDDLVQQLNEAKSIIVQLTEKLQLSHQQEELIKVLKSKAQQFEEYIKSSSPEKSLSSSSSAAAAAAERNKSNTPKKIDRCVATTPELEKMANYKIEARIRDEMAKIFTVEIKRFQVKLYETEEQLLALQTDYKQTKVELIQRQTEVDVLKQAILAEREKFDELLNEKAFEFKEVLQKQRDAILQKTLKELQEKDRKITKLLKVAKNRDTQIEAERKSMKVVMAQWEEHRKNVDNIESEYKETIQKLKESHAIELSSWRAKYNSALRTSENYKRYADDKEAHVRRELDRHRLEYDKNCALWISFLRDMTGCLRENDKLQFEGKFKEFIASMSKNRGVKNGKENKIAEKN